MTARRTTTPRRQRRILAYLDPEAENKTLLEVLVRRAQRDEAEVLALCVLRDLPWYAQVSGRVSSALEHEARDALAKSAAVLAQAGVKVRTQVRWGRPFEVIIQEVLRRPTQLVLKTARGDGKGESRLFGSTAMHLFRKCPVPVWIIKPRRTSRIRRVLAAVDPTEPASGEADLNVEILRLAQRLAREEGAEFHVCHAFTILGEHLLRSRMSRSEHQRYLEEVQDRVRAGLAVLLAEFELSLGDRNVHLLKGDPAQLIPALAAHQRTDLLVMGTIARSGVPGLLIGNTAERMLGAVDCSVLAIKPRGFVSPVRPGT